MPRLGSAVEELRPVPAPVLSGSVTSAPVRPALPQLMLRVSTQAANFCS